MAGPVTISERIDPSSPTSEAPARCPVSTHNEWDPLEEVVLGRLDGAAANSPAIAAEDTRRDLQELAALLERHDVTVRRPEATKHERTFETAHWKERGFSSACPRDAVLVLGDEIIETPLAWRPRYYETDALRTLFLSYFRAGARWTSAPRPELRDDLYEAGQGDWLGDETPPVVVTEAEPILCAADVARCGHDLFALRTAGTNQAGIDWLRRHLCGDYRVHQLEPRRQIAGSLDTVFLPLSPRDVLIREEAFDPAAFPEALRDYRIRVAPAGGGPMGANVLLLDPERVLVERTETALIEAVRTWGFEPLPVALTGYEALGGSVRRATLDIRRSGSAAQ